MALKKSKPNRRQERAHCGHRKSKPNRRHSSRPAAVTGRAWPTAGKKKREFNPPQKWEAPPQSRGVSVRWATSAWSLGDPSQGGESPTDGEIPWHPSTPDGARTASKWCGFAPLRSFSSPPTADRPIHDSHRKVKSSMLKGLISRGLRISIPRGRAEEATEFFFHLPPFGPRLSTCYIPPNTRFNI